MFEIKKSGNKTSPGEIGLDIRTHASPKLGQGQVSGGVSVLCWHAALIAEDDYDDDGSGDYEKRQKSAAVRKSIFRSHSRDMPLFTRNP